MNRTLDTLYLSSDEVVDDLLCNDLPIHEWRHNPVDCKYYTAVWAGQNKCEFRQGQDCIKEEETLAPRSKPTFFDLDLLAAPANLEAQIVAANAATGSVRIQLADGVYRTGDLQLTKSNVTICAQNNGQATLSGEWKEPLTWSQVFGTGIYQAMGMLPKEIQQVHVDFAGRIERLADGFDGTDPWTQPELSDAPTGGWYREGNSLRVKMPDGSNPTGRVHLAGNYIFALECLGDDIWIEGIKFEYYGLKSDQAQHYHQNKVSGIQFAGRRITARECEFQYLRSHSINCNGCTDVLIENNRFHDGQEYMTYRQARNSSHNLAGGDHGDSGRILLNRVTTATVRNNLHGYNLQALILAGCRFVDVYDNDFHRARNIPVEIRDGKDANTGDVNRVGGEITVWRNRYLRVGWSLPNNEDNAETGPVWWINNCVNEFGWPGNDFNSDTIKGLAANRYGGSDNCTLLGVQLVYNNLIATSQTHPSFESYFGWVSAAKDLRRGSCFFNNLWVIPDVDGSIVWAARSGGPGSSNSVIETSDWDYNQYWMGGDPKAFILGLAWELDQIQSCHPNFEANGRIDVDPGWAGGCSVSNPIPKKIIDGVTGNTILGLAMP